MLAGLSGLTGLSSICSGSCAEESEAMPENQRASAWCVFFNPPIPDGELDEPDRSQAWGGYPN